MAKHTKIKDLKKGQKFWYQAEILKVKVAYANCLLKCESLIEKEVILIRESSDFEVSTLSL